MQGYRHTPITLPADVKVAYEDVKQWIRRAAQGRIAELEALRKFVAGDLLKHVNGEEYERSLAGLYALLTENDEFSAAAQLKEK
jgi:hypothetical protein